MRILFLAVALFCAAAFSAGLAGAQTAEQKSQQQRQVTQPGNNADVWREVQRGDPNYTSIPGREMNVLIQPPARFLGQDVRVTAGEAWRQFRNGPVTFWGGWLVVLVCAAIGALYLVKGPVKLHDRPTGRLLPRFTTAERVVHWTVAISFCVLGLSGLIMLFGKHVLLPVIGYTLFAWLTALCKNLHNFIAPMFIVSVLVMVVMWAKDNLPRSYDWRWIANMPAFFLHGKHLPSGRFNGMEKVWFWGFVVVVSVVVTWSGLILLFPNFDQTRATMQDAWIWHAVAALLYIAMALGHIYMGTIGVEGAYRNMREGVTDETWAKEHHSIWYEEMKARKPSASRGAVPAGAPHMKEKA
jgi:formate dehydrogenase subunit gamma